MTKKTPLSTQLMIGFSAFLRGMLSSARVTTLLLTAIIVAWISPLLIHFGVSLATVALLTTFGPLVVLGGAALLGVYLGFREFFKTRNLDININKLREAVAEKTAELNKIDEYNYELSLFNWLSDAIHFEKEEIGNITDENLIDALKSFSQKTPLIGSFQETDEEKLTKIKAVNKSMQNWLLKRWHGICKLPENKLQKYESQVLKFLEEKPLPTPTQITLPTAAVNWRKSYSIGFASGLTLLAIGGAVLIALFPPAAFGLAAVVIGTGIMVVCTFLGVLVGWSHHKYVAPKQAEMKLLKHHFDKIAVTEGDKKALQVEKEMTMRTHLQALRATFNLPEPIKNTTAFMHQRLDLSGTTVSSSSQDNDEITSRGTDSSPDLSTNGLETELSDDDEFSTEGADSVPINPGPQKQRL